LEKAQASGGTGGIYAQQTYTYDQLGNLTNNGNGTLTYGTQSAAPTCPDGALTKPHAVVSGNGNTYCYDTNGNQVKRILGANTLTYDAENRLTTVSGATSASFVYDGDGNRVKSVVNGVTTYYIGNHFEWRSTTGNMGRYYYADGQRIAMRYGSTVYYLLGDHLGSTTLTVTGSGAKYAEQRYYPWGDTRYTYWKTPTAYQFTGQYHDTDLGLYFYNARYYDSYLNRFISPDTIIPDPKNPQDLNRYSYTRNNPVRYTDPTGHCIFGVDTLVCIAVGGAVVGGLIGYGTQVYANLQSGVDLGTALTTDISAEPIISGALLGGALAAGGAYVAAALGVGGTGAAATGGAATVAGGAVQAAGADGDPTNEIQTGINTVYQLVENGSTRYVGVTNNFMRRAGEHMSQKGWQIEPIQGLENLSRYDARAVEQVLIERYGIGNLYNQINSIATTNPIYQKAIERGTEILKHIME